MFPGKYFYAGVIFLFLFCFVWTIATGRSFNYNALVMALVTSGTIFGVSLLMRRILSRIEFSNPVQNNSLLIRHKDRVITLLDGMFFISIGWISLRLFNHLTMTIGFEYQDAFLASADRFLHLDWQAYFEFIAGSPALILAFDYSYTKLSTLTGIALITLIVSGQVEKARFFVYTFVLTALFCTVVGMFFPAKAAVSFLLNDPSLISNFPYSPGTYSVEIIEKLRVDPHHIFNIHKLPGLTTFPSFHTAAGVVMVYAFRKTVFFWTVLIYTIIMIASTPIFGGHYFVDLIAGWIVAVFVCKMVEKVFNFTNLYQS